MPVPDHYNRLMPYLIVPGANQFIDYMQDVFQATVQVIVPRSENIIMHGELRIGESAIMFADVTPEFGACTTGIFIYVDNVDETYRKALEKDSQSKMAPAQQSYGYTCGFRDPFGNDWWATEIPQE